MKRSYLKVALFPAIFVLLLITTLSIELFTKKDGPDRLAERIESRLHQQEREADRALNKLDSLDDFNDIVLPKGVTLIILQEEQIIYWSDEEATSRELASMLEEGSPIILSNNSLYEVRERDIWEARCYTLLLIRSYTPYDEGHTKSGFAEYLGVSELNPDDITIYSDINEGEYLIKDYKERPLLSLSFAENFSDTPARYGLLILYSILFILLFVIYDRIMEFELSVSKQLIIFLLFSLFLALLYILLIHYRIPESIFNLSLFERKQQGGADAHISVGEILVYAYTAFMVMSITIFRLRSNKKKLRPFRFFISFLWILFTYLYANLYTFAIRAMVEKFDVCMNVALVINIGYLSWVVFITIALGGVALIVAMDRVVSVYLFFISRREAFWTTLLFSGLLFIPCLMGWSQISIADWGLYTVMLLVIILNKYSIKADHQRSVYTILLFVFCFYLMMVMKGSEEKNELMERHTRAEMLLENRGESYMASDMGGYTRLLGAESDNDYYLYSYALYDSKGELQHSSGTFMYHKLIEERASRGEERIIEGEGYSHLVVTAEDGRTAVVSLPLYYLHTLFYLNVLYLFFIVIFLSSYSLIYHLNYRDGVLNVQPLKTRIRNSINTLIFILFVILTLSSILLNLYSFRQREQEKALNLLSLVTDNLESSNFRVTNRRSSEMISDIATMLKSDINIYDGASGRILLSSRPDVFENGYCGYLINPEARSAIIEEGETNILLDEKMGNNSYKSAYGPLILDDGTLYIVNIIYFVENSEFNRDITTSAIFAVNIAIVLMMLSFTLSAWLAGRMVRPLSLINDKLRNMSLVGKNERIEYGYDDEIGLLVKQYNETIEQLEESADKLAKSERESAWREMARQIAHEIKNPLTPMKLNIQFLKKSIESDDPQLFRERFEKMSDILLEQINSMAATASAFSDFAKLYNVNPESFNLTSFIEDEITLLRDEKVEILTDLEQDVEIYSDKQLLGRALVNVIQNAKQSIVEGTKGVVQIVLRHLTEEEVEIRVRDNGSGIDASLGEKIFEPNFTTKSRGMGLGLSISKQIVEMLNGSITFRSIEEGGTEFIIILRDVAT